VNHRVGRSSEFGEGNSQVHVRHRVTGRDSRHVPPNVNCLRGLAQFKKRIAEVRRSLGVVRPCCDGTPVVVRCLDQPTL